MKIFDIQLSSWILADGNYEFVRFAVGEKIRFAVEFYLREYALTFDELHLKACKGKPSFYNSVSEIVFLNDKACVLDFGIISAYRNHSPKEISVGQRLCAELSLHIDPFHYYEELSKYNDIQPLIYGWELNAIDMETDQGYVAINEINTREDRERGCTESYILHCSLINSKATKDL